MASPRIKRLAADYRDLAERFAPEHPVRIVARLGDPPESYEIEFLMNGLRRQDDGRIAEQTLHRLDVTLPAAYPRQAPQCRLLTPLFHPNVNGSEISPPGKWFAAESLADWICRIGELITFQRYDLDSPLNREAAKWAVAHQGELPLESVDLFPPAPQPPRCANCNAPGPYFRLSETAPGIFHCQDCLAECPHCRDAMALGENVCHACLEKARGEREAAHVLLCHGDLIAAADKIDALLIWLPGDSDARALRSAIAGAQALITGLDAESLAAYVSRRFVRYLALTARIQELNASTAEMQTGREHAVATVGVARSLFEDALEGASGNLFELKKKMEKILEICADFEPALNEMNLIEKKIRALKTEFDTLQEKMQLLIEKETASESEIHELDEIVRRLGPMSLSLGANPAPVNQGAVMLRLWKTMRGERMMLLGYKIAFYRRLSLASSFLSLFAGTLAIAFYFFAGAQAWTNLPGVLRQADWILPGRSFVPLLACTAPCILTLALWFRWRGLRKARKGI